MRHPLNRVERRQAYKVARNRRRTKLPSSASNMALTRRVRRRKAVFHFRHICGRKREPRYIAHLKVTISAG